MIFEIDYDIIYKVNISRHDGMADVTDSKSVGSDTVRVQVPLPALQTLVKSRFLKFILSTGDNLSQETEETNLVYMFN